MDLSHLKGITSTNDDPSLCAICCDPVPKGAQYKVGSEKSLSVLTWCCGKLLCRVCHEGGFGNVGDINAEGFVRCALCNEIWTSGTGTKALKKHSKKGRPWAQFLLALTYVERGTMVHFTYDTVRLLRKAAQQGHPEACFHLGGHCARGEGCVRDISEARKFLAEAVSIDIGFVNDVHEELVDVAVYCWENNEVEEAISILTPLASAGMSEAQSVLGMIRFDLGDYQLSYELLLPAALHGSILSEALDGDEKAAASLFGCCLALHKYPQARLCLTTSCRLKEVWMSLSGASDMLDMIRSVKDNCGGCGANLDATTKQTCKQCRAISYCNRRCQKLHWNCQGGHATDCKEAKALKDKFKNVRRK